MFNYRAGDTIRIALKYVDFPAGQSIAGYKYWFTIKSSLADTDASAVAQIVSTAGDTTGDVISTAAQNVKVLLLQDGVLTPGTYFFDIQCKTAAGDIVTIYPPAGKGDGRMKIQPQVTLSTS